MIETSKTIEFKEVFGKDLTEWETTIIKELDSFIVSFNKSMVPFNYSSGEPKTLSFGS
ncbi:MAG: hypothetical protein LBN01_04570 [Endomicrobium sp.]|nr:hypothetical protein [Endomicrobium sp.]